MASPLTLPPYLGPSPSIIPDTDPHTPLEIPSTSLPHTSSSPLYNPTLSDTIHDRDTIINARTQRTTRSDTNSLPKPKPHYNDIHTITSFITINDTPFHDPLSHSFEHLNHHDLFHYSFLSAPLPSFKHRITDLSKPPNTYHEALSRPDKQAWISAMKHEFDSLEECKAFERTSLQIGRAHV